jgi:hypothetical protein
MNLNLSQIQFEAAKLVSTLGTNALTQAMDAAGQTPVGTLGVYWLTSTGGTRNPSTGGMIGATETLNSGTLTAIGVEEPARTVLRQFAEIAVGDLLVTLRGDPQVLTAGGAVPLSGIANPWFVWSGREYSQKDMSNDLRTLWSESVQGVRLSSGLLLRRNT